MAEKYHYKCINCDRTLTTSQKYPDGQWVCTNCRKLKIPIYLTCTVCGKKFPVQFDTYRLNKDKTDWRCRRCNDDYRNSVYQAKSPEEKAKFKESQAAHMKAYYANMTDEERAKNHENRKKGWVKRYERGTAESSLEAMQEGRAKWWNSLNDEEKLHYWNFLNDGRIKWLESLSSSEREAYVRMIGEKSKESWNNLSEEEYKKRVDKLRMNNQKFWDNITPEEYQRMEVDIAMKLRDFKDSNPNAAPAIELTKTETEFANLLNLNGLGYIPQYPNIKIHPEFNDKFKINEATGSNLISPIHIWGFVVKTKSGDVLIDIDGSIHDPANNPINRFNDSKRPYQTDGMISYVVSCPDDRLDPNNGAINVSNGSEMSLYSLIQILKFMDGKISKKDLKFV